MVRPFNRERKSLFTKQYWTSGSPHAKELSRTPTSHHVQKRTQKWLTDLNVIAKITKRFLMFIYFESERERESQAVTTLSAESHAGLDLKNRKIIT